MSNVALRAVSSGIAVMAVLRCCVLEVTSLKTILTGVLGVLGEGGRGEIQVADFFDGRDTCLLGQSGGVCFVT